MATTPATLVLGARDAAARVARRRTGGRARRRSPAAAQAPDAPTRLEPIVVTATGLEQKAGDTSSRVRTVTLDWADHDGVISIGESFQFRGGVRLRF